MTEWELSRRERNIGGVIGESPTNICYVSYDTLLLPPGSPLTPLKKVLGMIVTPYFLKKKKAGEVTTFFVFSDTSHLFNLYTYYNTCQHGINRQCATL